MQQKLILKPQVTQTAVPPLLTFNMPDVDGLFPGFKLGDFAVIYGPQSMTSLISQLCIRAQLPRNLGGLESKVVFIDAANSSSLSDTVLTAEKTITMRAYTAYRLTSLITEKLDETVKVSGAKLVVISDIAGSFLSDNVDDQEAKAVYSQIMSYLSSFARRHRIIVIATCLPHENNKRNSTLQEINTAKANTVLRFTKTPYTSEVELEKHPCYMLGVAEFTVATTNRKSAVPTLSYSILKK